jgi:lipoprotein-anchoring transpeptidase ErfK/SrfK
VGHGQRGDDGRARTVRWLVGGTLAVALAAGVGVAALGGVGVRVDDAAVAVGPTDGGEVGTDDSDVAAREAARLEEASRAAAEQRRAEREAAERQAAEREEAEREAEEARLERERLAEERRVEEERLAAERAAEEAAEEAEAARRALVAAQERLIELGYLLGAADGEQGQRTTAALMAFQAVNAIQVDGILGPQTTATLASPAASPQLAGGPATRIEVDLDRQVLHLVEGGERVVTLKVSSGNGATYSRGDGSQGRAVTPVGTFTIERRIAGVRESSAGLGTLYDPMYFYGGFAIHGSNSVPAGPASHGCVRVSRADAVWLFDRVPNGTPVVLYGGQHVFRPA